MAVWSSWYIIACLVHVILLKLWVQPSLLDNFLHLYTTCSKYKTSCGFLPESFRTPQGVQSFKDQSFRILEDSLRIPWALAGSSWPLLRQSLKVLRESLSSPQTPQPVLRAPQNSLEFLRIPWGSVGQCHVLCLPPPCYFGFRIKYQSSHCPWSDYLGILPNLVVMTLCICAALACVLLSLNLI